MIVNDPLRHLSRDQILNAAEEIFISNPEQQKVLDSLIFRLQVPEGKSAYAAAQDEKVRPIY